MARESALPTKRPGDHSHDSAMTTDAVAHCQDCESSEGGEWPKRQGSALLPRAVKRFPPFQPIAVFYPGLPSSKAAPVHRETLLQSAPIPTTPMQVTGSIAAEHGEFPAGSGRVQLEQPSHSARERWSADSWLLLRRDTSASITSGRPSYGRSQAGAALRYHFASSSPHHPQAYLRASAALAGAREQEIALGLSSLPLPGAPLRLAVEARASQTVSGSELRLAAYAITELPAFRLPFGARGEAYAQGGYVGGEFATPFVDGQIRAERPIARIGSMELSIGAGAWGGAQKDSGRLDTGPSATATFRIGKGFGRIAADYRFRIAGEAEPSSGPALTLSAGF